MQQFVSFWQVRWGGSKEIDKVFPLVQSPGWNQSITFLFLKPLILTTLMIFPFFFVIHSVISQTMVETWLMLITLLKTGMLFLLTAILFKSKQWWENKLHHTLLHFPNTGNLKWHFSQENCHVKYQTWFPYAPKINTCMPNWSGAQVLHDAAICTNQCHCPVQPIWHS